MSGRKCKRICAAMLAFASLTALLPNETYRLLADEQNVRHASDHYGRVAFSPDGKRLAIGSHSGKIHFWDLVAQRFDHSLSLSERRAPRHLAWSPDGRQIAVCGFGLPLSIFDVTTGKQLHSFTPRSWGGSSQINGIAWHPSGKSLVVSLPRAVANWNPASPRLPKLQWPTKAGKRFYGWHGLSNSTGRQFAMVDESGGFRLWNLETGRLQHDLSTFRACQVYLAWSPDNKTIALSSSERVRLLNPKSGKTIRDVKTPSQSSIVSWSPDGRMLAVAQGWLGRYSSVDKPDKKISLINPSTGTIVRTLDSGVKNIGFLAWSPDGRRLASGGTNRVLKRDKKSGVRVTSNPELPVSLWDPSNGKLVHRLSVPSR